MNGQAAPSGEADMKLRLPTAAIVLIMSGLLCGCAAGRAPNRAGSSPTSPAVATRTKPTTVIVSVQGFYSSYVASRAGGHGAGGVLARTHVAAWYLPIFTAPSGMAADRVDCGLRGTPADWSFSQVGELGGQTVIVIGSRPRDAPQQLWSVVTTEPGTGKITGITCAIGGANVTSTGARNAATSLYSYYLAARGRGASPGAVISRLIGSGSTSSSSYLHQAEYAFARHQLAYDPVTCTGAGVPNVSVGTAQVVAGGSVGLVVASADRTRALVTVVLGAKGWTVGDIACHQPPVGAGS